MTGGAGDSGLLDSTELLLPSADSWTTIESAALPSPRDSLRGATLDNKVLITGTDSNTLVRYYTILMICVVTNNTIRIII